MGDENRSPNDNSFRETTPNIDLGISLVNKALESPYSPHSNPFGKRPSQRTPGALAFVRRLSELKSPSTEAELDTMGGGGYSTGCGQALHAIQFTTLVNLINILHVEIFTRGTVLHWLKASNAIDGGSLVSEHVDEP